MTTIHNVKQNAYNLTKSIQAIKCEITLDIKLAMGMKSKKQKFTFSIQVILFGHKTSYIPDKVSVTSICPGNLWNICYIHPPGSAR